MRRILPSLSVWVLLGVPVAGTPLASGKLSLLSQASSRVVRIYFGGTSIEYNGDSGAKTFLQSLQRRFGDSGNRTLFTATLGDGSVSSPFNGWQKQGYGGLTFHRLRGDHTSSDLTFAGLATQFVLHYSTESDGGSFQVAVDGAAAGTINCSGVQSYNNTRVLDLPAAGYHTITLHPPASGYAYFETLDINQNRPGIHIIDGTGGGTLARNFFVPAAGGVAPVPIVGNNGVDSYMLTDGPTKPDLVLFAWVVNDCVDLATWNGYYPGVIQRVVTTAAAQGQQVILLMEMGGAHAVPSDSGNAAFDAIRALFASYASNPNVTVIDWDAASRHPGDSNLTAWQSWAGRFYTGKPGGNAVITQVSPSLIASGDFIHPNAEGQSIGADLLLAAANLPSYGLGGFGSGSGGTVFDAYNALLVAAENQIKTGLGSVAPYLAPPSSPPGQEKTETDQLGAAQHLAAIGYSAYLASYPNLRQTLWTSDTATNLDPTVNRDIAASGTSDRWGKYRNYSYTGFPLAIPSTCAGKYVTWTFVVGNSSGGNGTPFNLLIAGYPSGTYGNLTPYIFDAPLPAAYDPWVTSNNPQATAIYTGEPTVVHFTTLMPAGSTAGNFSVTGKVYAVYVTPTDYPVIPLH